MERKLFIKDVAAQIGVTKTIVSLWETHRSEPTVSKIPGIIRFLGFVPYRAAGSLGDWLKLVRSSLGYSQRQLAALIKGDQRSIREWEAGTRVPTPRSINKLKAVF